MAGTEYLYRGNSYSLSPAYLNPISYLSPAGGFGSSLDARTANQVKETSEMLNSGIKIIEVSAHSPEVFDAMPNEQLTELRRLAKLTGAQLTMHAPMIDPTGISQQGWNKFSQKSAEKQLWNAIERSHELNPKGNINVTMHATTTGFPGSELKMMEGKKGEEIEKIKQMILIDPASGKIRSIAEEEKYFPTKEGQKIGEKIPFNPAEEIERINNEDWMKRLSGLTYYTSQGEAAVQNLNQMGKSELFKEYGVKTPFNLEEVEKMKELKPEDKKTLITLRKDYERVLNHGAVYLKDAYTNLKELYDDVYKNAKPEEQQQLNNFAQQMVPLIKDIDNVGKDPEKLAMFAEKIEEGVKVMNKMKPRMFIPIKEFAADRSAETIGNIALQSWNAFHETSPVISVENHPAFNALITTGDEIRDVVVKARQNFVDLVVKEQGLSRSEAEQQAKKLIGATWDVGHINMLKKYGYTDADIIKQTEKVAPFVNKVHLSDNFGFEHTELPMGMGNVPIQKIMEKLGKAGFEGPKISEALSWWQHFSPGGKTNPPFVQTLQNFGAGIASSGNVGWNQVYGSSPGGYFSGYGTMLPEQHFSMYGAGFSNLPTELGGQVSNKDSRFSGTPMN